MTLTSRRHGSVRCSTVICFAVPPNEFVAACPRTRVRFRIITHLIASIAKTSPPRTTTGNRHLWLALLASDRVFISCASIERRVDEPTLRISIINFVQRGWIKVEKGRGEVERNKRTILSRIPRIKYDPVTFPRFFNFSFWAARASCERCAPWKSAAFN